MATANRAIRVGEQIHQLLSALMLERMRDPRLRRVTLTEVILSRDLRQARIYFSVMGDEAVCRAAQAALENATGFMKREIGRCLALRYVPEIRFFYDASLEQAARMEEILESLHVEDPDEEQ